MPKRNCIFSFFNESSTLDIKLGGEIDHHSAVAVRSEIDTEIRSFMPKRTIIDLSGIEFMDSSGLGLIMGRYSLMQKIGGELVVKNPSKRIMDIFELAGFQKMIKIEKDSDDKCKEEKKL